ITRTVGIGAVSDEHRRFFTLVLKGMIEISTARFPKGTRGCDLDPLARIAALNLLGPAHIDKVFDADAETAGPIITRLV
ncbi:M24 family metallopeptidase, partial [Rhizobium ruizarguesonis]